MKYWVTYKIESRYVALVDAEDIRDALSKGYNKYLEADFGESEDVEGEAISVETEDGDIVWER